MTIRCVVAHDDGRASLPNFASSSRFKRDPPHLTAVHYGSSTQAPRRPVVPPTTPQRPALAPRRGPSPGRPNRDRRRPHAGARSLGAVAISRGPGGRWAESSRTPDAAPQAVHRACTRGGPRQMRGGLPSLPGTRLPCGTHPEVSGVVPRAACRRSVGSGFTARVAWPPSRRLMLRADRPSHAHPQRGACRPGRARSGRASGVADGHPV